MSPNQVFSQSEPCVTSGKQSELFVTSGKQSELFVTSGKQTEPFVISREQREPFVTFNKQSELFVTSGKQSELLVTSGKLLGTRHEVSPNHIFSTFCSHSFSSVFCCDVNEVEVFSSVFCCCVSEVEVQPGFKIAERGTKLNFLIFLYCGNTVKTDSPRSCGPVVEYPL